MGHKVGAMACRSYITDHVSVNIDIERGETTPLLIKQKDYQVISEKLRWDAKLILLSCFLIVGSFIGLYLLFEQGSFSF